MRRITIKLIKENFRFLIFYYFFSHGDLDENIVTVVCVWLFQRISAI